MIGLKCSGIGVCYRRVFGCMFACATYLKGVASWLHACGNKRKKICSCGSHVPLWIDNLSFCIVRVCACLLNPLQACSRHPNLLGELLNHFKAKCCCFLENAKEKGDFGPSV